MIPDVTYLILNFNPAGEATAQDILGATLEAFYNRKSPHLRSEVFLLDQGTTDPHRRWLLEAQGRYGFASILLNGNVGISGAINHVVRASRSPVFGLITSDVMVTSGLDEDLFQKVQVQEVFQATPFTDKSDLDYQCWQPREAFGADRPDLAALKGQEQSLLGKVFGGDRRGYLRCVGAEFNVMFWRRGIFQEVGYFDERWKACYENNDFSLRCFLAGGCTAISYDSFVWHVHKVTEKNQARQHCFADYGPDGPQAMRALWDEKWPDLERFLRIYKPLKNRTVADFPEFQERFRHNTYLPFEAQGA